ncbi:histone-lysine N-methyltransferase SETD5 isoform X1 [Leucoraja erinacea]|uniref:histone-lysine N-methyltransferase SETD5 isoform X1 n=1 Tax=Leucoraja erinaceus TaxID=7782 RepID=UPI0024574ED8|nr:histone-lysine N-methyltransferase SETD5 isoform X1 [Leucoraja erinacea]XP_055504077.1 histone-lysine N-methyltransferase SETD5 isoform X1 [Leucoraja erinacea]XP_055504078.1 histone-lysine N-methyltransferase SETD5 isoform X1 [Leucoraja erinacea]XP_055504079.1 histone-lysine N-methyltransferase SETD5 isoform X1 [Leucoraja erinacea]XP_055504080.1 histone-lysine N-methyltransferase SETD5 isoform X1 [Leucoraja erinacea]XP_055504081.1 histone-lysine N-methyltransferase SETD5 isoform X1 [Leucora
MSIVIPLGVTTPDTSYSDMAAGSDPESVEASPAVAEKNSYANHNYGSAQHHGYRGLPYADHNYGAPPPPTPPASPPAQTIIARVELNRLRCPRYDDNSEDSDSSSEDENLPWCHCSLTQDGFIITCENCRGLDRRKVIRLQRRKQENVSVGDSSATESGDEEVSPSTVSYTATQHTPTSITLTVNRVKRTKAKKRKRSTEKSKNAPKAKKIKAFREGSRRSMRMKNSLSEAHALDENTAEGWENRIRLWTDQFEESFANQYSADVQNLLELHRLTMKDSVGKNVVLDTINKTELACNNTVLGSQMQLQLGKVTRVQRHRKILRAARDLTPDILIIEYRGKVMLRQQFEVNGHFFKRPYPFVLFYSKFNEVEMCVDARTFGNDARFIRRSCAPNAEVRHMIADGMIHLCIYAITNIPKDNEVTIGFDYEYSSCKYKVDCACHKGNQNCPVQKHNQGSMEPPLGAETRRRKARRKEWEMESELNQGSDENSSQQQEEAAEPKDQQELPAQNPASDSEEGPGEGDQIKVEEENEESEMDEQLRALAQNKLSREQRKMEAIMQVFENLEKRKKRREHVVERSTSHPGDDGDPETPTTDVEEVKLEPAAEEEPLPSEARTPQPVLAGVSTRQTSQLGEQVQEKPAKPPASKPTKPRPKNRFSRYRSSSAQRLRRQRQASCQSEPAPVVAVEEGATGTVVTESISTEGVPSVGAPGVETISETTIVSQPNRTNVKYPKTKRYLVTEWLNDKVERSDCPYDRPLRITTDPTVLATTLNMLPGLSHSPHICTTPKHYIRFGSPFTPERRRQRVVCDGSYGSCKKRWMKQAMDEAMVQLPLTPDIGQETPPIYHSNDSSNVPDELDDTNTSTELIAPLKKRKARYLSDVSLTDLPGPCSPLSAPASVTDTAMSSPTIMTPCTLFPGEEDKKNGYNTVYSPLHSLAASRCNTPLQFENISSPESSPVHRPEPISPEPPLRADNDQSRTGFSDLSLQADPDATTLRVTVVTEVPLSDCAAQLPCPTLTFPSESETGFTGRNSDGPLSLKNAEQAFRTEFNLIYACSPLNSNLRDLTPTHRLEGPYRGLENRTNYTSDRKSSQSERGFGDAVYMSPSGDSSFSRQGQGFLPETLPGSMSPQADRQPFSEGNTTPQQNPPQKKKVSLLEYRKRQQEARGSNSKSDCLSSDLSKTPSNMGTPTRRNSDGTCAQSATNGDSTAISRSRRSSSPPSGFSSPVHASVPQVEEVSPSDPASSRNATLSAAASIKSRNSMSTRWMVPTSVERLREDRGTLERVLRRVEIGSMKRTGEERSTLDRVLRRIETSAVDSAREKDTDSTDGEGSETHGLARIKSSPIQSPQRYSHSPSRYNHQAQSDGVVPESHVLPQQSMSPYRTHSSSSVPSAHTQGHVYRSSSHSMGQSGSQHPIDSSLTTTPVSTLYLSPVHSTSVDTSVVQYVGNSGYYSGQQHSGSVLHTLSSAQQKTNSGSTPSIAASPLQSTTKNLTDSTSTPTPSTINSTVSQTAKPSQSGSWTSSPAGSGQALHSGAKIGTASSSQHYRRTGVTQYQPPQVQGANVRTQSSTY